MAKSDTRHVAALERAIKLAGPTQAKFADSLREFCGDKKPSQQLVCYWLNKKVRLDPEWWEAIEKATDGQVTRRDLRPELFQDSSVA